MKTNAHPRSYILSGSSLEGNKHTRYYPLKKIKNEAYTSNYAILPTVTLECNFGKSIPGSRFCRNHSSANSSIIYWPFSIESVKIIMLQQEVYVCRSMMRTGLSIFYYLAPNSIILGSQVNYSIWNSSTTSYLTPLTEPVRCSSTGPPRSTTTKHDSAVWWLCTRKHR